MLRWVLSEYVENKICSRKILNGRWRKEKSHMRIDSTYEVLVKSEEVKKEWISHFVVIVNVGRKAEVTD